MKKFLFTIAIACLIIVHARAQQIVPQEEEVIPYQEKTTPQQEGKEALSEVDLPDLVKQGFSQSEYQAMSITKAYRLSGKALDDVIATTEGPKPKVLYEIHIANENMISKVYFTEQGELYEVAKKV